MSTSNYFCYFHSPIGKLVLQGDDESLTGLYLPSHKGWVEPDASWQHCERPFDQVRKQLAEYFAGERTQFHLPIKLNGTSFQQRVWGELIQIPFGTTINYGDLARRIGQPNASRAVGNANGRNPISIIVPCHRVIGTNGRLTGYAGGVAKKQWLLDWERGRRSLPVPADSFDFSDSSPAMQLPRMEVKSGI